MSETMWLSLALGRLSIRTEMLEQENAQLRQEIAALKGKGPQLVKREEENGDADATGN